MVRRKSGLCGFRVKLAGNARTVLPPVVHRESVGTPAVVVQNDRPPRELPSLLVMFERGGFVQPEDGPPHPHGADSDRRILSPWNRGRPRGYVPPFRRALAMPRKDWTPIIERAAEIVAGYDTAVTLRQVHYRLVGEGLIENTVSDYNECLT